MKSMFLTVWVIIGWLAMPQPTAAQGQPEKALQDAASARMKSMASGDAEGWGKYTTDDFVVIEADGSMKTKAQRMAEIKSTPTPVPASSNADQKWRAYGPSTAVSITQAPIDGKPTRITTVWVKQQGEWKAASVQLTTITAAR